MKKKCCHCNLPSIPGLKRSVGLCQYHYNMLQYGKEWADKCREDSMLYFEPQTGIVKRTPIRSNFYVYRLDDKYLAKVELAVNDAVLRAEGLVYTKDFIEWLSKVDTHWNQKTGLPTPWVFRS